MIVPQRKKPLESIYIYIKLAVPAGLAPHPNVYFRIIFQHFPYTKIFLDKVFFPTWGWGWFGLSKKSGSVYFFAILEVVGWRGINYPRPMDSNATIVVSYPLCE